VLRFGNRSLITQLQTHLTVTLPPGVAVVVANGATVANDTVTWDLGDVTPTQTGERRLAVSITGLGAADPLVRVTRAVLASTTGAARESVTTTLDAAPLGLVLAAVPDPVGRGAALTYSLTVTNHRGVTASDLQLRVPVPPGMAGNLGCQAVSDAGSFPTNCVVGRDVTWNLGQLAMGANRTVQVTFLTGSSGGVPQNGTILPATARLSDAAGGACGPERRRGHELIVFRADRGKRDRRLESRFVQETRA